MTILHKLKVTSNLAYLESAPSFVAGTADTVRLETFFDQSWDGFSVELLVEQKGADVRWKLSLDEKGGTVLPEPLTREAIPFFLWAEGTNGDQFLRTNSVCISPEKLCTGDGEEPPAEQTLPVYSGPYCLTENGVYALAEHYLTENITVDVPPVGVDTTRDTVSAEVLLEGFTAHDRAKQPVVGVIPTYQGLASVELTSPDGTVLPVANTYCGENIAVRPRLQSLQVTENGNFFPAAGYSGIEQVEVNIQPRMQTKTAVSNGTVTPDEGYDGLSAVEVQVSSKGMTAVTFATGNEIEPDAEYASVIVDLPILSATCTAVGTIES